MTQLYVYQGPRPSESARVLVNTLKQQGVSARRLKEEDEPLWGFPVFNWGNSAMTPMRLNPIVNPPEAVAKAISKRATAACLEAAGVLTVKITTEPATALRWLENDYRVFARRDGLSLGRGISELLPDGDISEADFYSRYFPKTHEFRVHIFDGQAIDIVEKKARSEVRSRIIRTHDNGWVFAHGNLSLEDTSGIKDLSKRAVTALGLTFGAVDILAILDRNSPRRLSKAVICEVNTAPGLENQQTINAYATAIREYTGNV